MDCQFTLEQKNPKSGAHVNECILLHTIFGILVYQLKPFLIHFIHLAHYYNMISSFLYLLCKAWFLPYTISPDENMFASKLYKWCLDGIGGLHTQ